MRLAVFAIVGLAACGLSRTGHADPPRILVDPWAKASPTTVSTDLVDPWRNEPPPKFVTDEVIDPWSVKTIPTARFPSLGAVKPARPPEPPPTSTVAPTARFPVVVDVVDPWKKP